MDPTQQILSTIEAMTSAFNRGDMDGILRTYEPGAVVVGEPGSTVTGAEALRTMFNGFISSKAHFTFQGHEVIYAKDIALHLTPWTMKGLAPDGTSIAASGLSIAVLRRQPDDRWLMVIDDPFGDAILARSGHTREEST